MNLNKCFIKILVCFVPVLLSSCWGDEKTLALAVIYRPLDSVQAIAPVSDSLVAPIVYTNVISLSKLPVALKKQKFIEMILPSILVAKEEVERSRTAITAIRKKLADSLGLTPQERIYLDVMMKRYKAVHIDSLDTKLTTPPNSIILAQAALECGWGTSRFFTEGCNMFGIWSFSKADERIRSMSDRKGGKKVYLKRYDNLSASIEDYFRVLGKMKVYRSFRHKIKASDDPYDLIPHLHRYSESGKAYTLKLASLIRQNNLTQYDHYSIDSSYFVEEGFW